MAEYHIAHPNIPITHEIPEARKIFFQVNIFITSLVLRQTPHFQQKIGICPMKLTFHRMSKQLSAAASSIAASSVAASTIVLC